MNKTLKFPHHYAEAILEQDSSITTRLFDEKRISAGDALTLIEKETGREFAEATVTEVRESSFEEIMKDAHDKEGMYQQYAGYYGKTIEPTTPMKMIFFNITKKMPLA